MARPFFFIFLYLITIAALVPGQEPSGDDPAGLVAALDQGVEGVADRLGSLGEKALPALFAGFSKLGDGARLRRATLLVRLAGADRTRELSLIFSTEPDPRVRLLLVHSLGRRDLPGWRDVIGGRVAGLAQGLRDADPVIREASLGRLVAMDEEQAVRVLVQEARRRSSKLRREALVGLAAMESAWKELPRLIPMVKKEAPGLLSKVLPGLGRRYCPEGLAMVVEFLGSGDQRLRSAAYQALFALNNWFFSRKEHGRRFALFGQAHGALPWNLDLALSRAVVVVMDDRKLADSRALCQSLAALVPAPTQQDWAPEGWARVQCLTGIDRFLAGNGKEALVLFRRAWNSLQAARARQPESPLNDVPLYLKTWTAWRATLNQPLAAETLKSFTARLEIKGGPKKDNVRHLLRFGGRLSLVAAVVAAISGEEKLARAWLGVAVNSLDDLEALWDDDYLRPFSEQTAILGGELGPVDLLLKGLGRQGRWADGERGFLFLLRGLSEVMPDFYLPPPASMAPGVKWKCGEKEKVFSSLNAHFAAFLSEAGEREKALAVSLALEKNLRGRGLGENQTSRMRVLFRLAGIYSDMRDPDKSEAYLKEYLQHYQGRKTEVQQRPELYGDPQAALRILDQMIAQAHVSLAVAANVLRQDSVQANHHCRRAYELDGSDFNRILYACYLARDGQGERARTLAEAVDVAPDLLYNLACTWALLGEKKRALALLRRDFAVNHLTPAARNLHRDWARRDRDLAPLKGQPEFVELLKKE